MRLKQLHGVTQMQLICATTKFVLFCPVISIHDIMNHVGFHLYFSSLLFNLLLFFSPFHFPPYRYPFSRSEPSDMRHNHLHPVHFVS